MTEMEFVPSPASGSWTDNGIPVVSPAHLYGRGAAIAQLMEAFRHVCQGHGQIVLVPGESGIGKTALVQSMEAGIHLQGGWFVQGKFDQYQQSTPYFSLRQALESVWHQVKSLRSEVRAAISERLVLRLGDPGALMVSLVPEMSAIFPEELAPEEINPAESRYRFTSVIREFLQEVCQPERPIVIFLDDWQWADPASLSLLFHLGINDTLRYLLLVVSYRTEDMSENTPLRNMIAQLERGNIPHRTIPVNALGSAEIEEILGDVLHGRIENRKALSDHVYRQTGGNPFYIRWFIAYLEKMGWLSFDSVEQQWQWRENTGPNPDSIVDLFLSILQRFSERSRKLLSMGACLGNRFSLMHLAATSRMTLAECAGALQPVVNEGLLSVSRPSDSLKEVEYRFMHDRIQQAAFQLIPAAEISAYHLNIGQQLVEKLSGAARENQLFNIVGHLNDGSSLISNTTDLLNLVELNMEAARRARSGTAYHAMLRFNRQAQHLFETAVPDTGQRWQQCGDMALKLTRSLAESEFIEGDKSRAEAWVSQALTYTDDPIKKADTLNILIVHYTLLARYDEAIAAGRLALGALGIELPDDDYEGVRDKEMAGIDRKLAISGIARLGALKTMNSPVHSTAVRLLITMGPPCYRTRQKLWSVLVAKSVALMLEHGALPQLGYAFPAYGGLLAWVRGDFEAAKAFGEVAERMMAQRFESPSEQSVFSLMIGSSTRHWFYPLERASEDYNKAYAIGLQSGNLQYAAYAFGHNMYCRFFRGIPLSDLIDETSQSLSFSRTRLNHWAIDLLEGGLLIFRALHTGTVEVPDVSDVPDDTQYIQQVESHHNIQVLCIYHILKSCYFLMMDDCERALAASDEAEGRLYTVGTQGLLPWPEHRFIRMLIKTGLFFKQDAAVQAKWKADFAAEVEFLAHLSRYNPVAYQHKYQLATAELARIEGRVGDAILAFNETVNEAAVHGYWQWEAVANERCYLMWLSLEGLQPASVYWLQSCSAFKQWGATAKEHMLLDCAREEYISIVERNFDDGALTANEMASFPDADGSEYSGGTASACCEDAADRYRELLNAQATFRVASVRNTMMSREASELASAMERLRTEISARERAQEERNQLEKQLRQSQKMQAVGTLAGGIAHEFNNMLGVIIGSTELAMDLTSDRIDLRRQLERIMGASERVQTLVKQILTFSRQSQHRRVPENLGALLTEALHLVESTIPSSIELNLEIAPNCAYTVVDRTEVQQIVMNICANAVWAMEERGTLDIRLNEVTLQEEAAQQVRVRTGRYLHLAFSDTGKGMDADTLLRIFEPFFTRKDVGQGTGMGLAIVYAIMESYGGSIVAQSSLGNGAVFHLYFPVTDEIPASRDATRMVPAGTEHILLVDDEPVFAAVCADTLKTLGYTVDVHNNGQSAIDAFSANPSKYHLVLTDQVMPGISGMELTERIKQIRPETPVILSTGYSHHINEGITRSHNIDAVVYKPFNRRVIAPLLRKSLDRK